MYLYYTECFVLLLFDSFCIIGIVLFILCSAFSVQCIKVWQEKLWYWIAMTKASEIFFYYFEEKFLSLVNRENAFVNWQNIYEEKFAVLLSCLIYSGWGYGENSNIIHFLKEELQSTSRKPVAVKYIDN